MRRTATLLGLTLLPFFPLPAEAADPPPRGLFLLGAGLTLPLGDLDSTHRRDLAVAVSGASRLKGALGIHMHWTYQRFQPRSTGDDATLWNLGLGPQLSFAISERVIPYVYATADLLQERLFGSATDPGLSLGGGLAIAFGTRAGIALDLRYSHGFIDGPGDLDWVTPTLNLVYRQ